MVILARGPIRGVFFPPSLPSNSIQDRTRLILPFLVKVDNWCNVAPVHCTVIRGPYKMYWVGKGPPGPWTWPHAAALKRTSHFMHASAQAPKPEFMRRPCACLMRLRYQTTFHAITYFQMLSRTARLYCTKFAAGILARCVRAFDHHAAHIRSCCAWAVVCEASRLSPSS